MNLKQALMIKLAEGYPHFPNRKKEDKKAVDKNNIQASIRARLNKDDSYRRTNNYEAPKELRD